jgi:hypothetical protein
MSSPIYNGSIYSRSGAHVGYVAMGDVFDLSGNKLYDLDGANLIDANTKQIVGRLRSAFEVQADTPEAADRLFPSMKDSSR